MLGYLGGRDVLKETLGGGSVSRAWRVSSLFRSPNSNYRKEGRSSNASRTEKKKGIGRYRDELSTELVMMMAGERFQVAGIHGRSDDIRVGG